MRGNEGLKASFREAGQDGFAALAAEHGCECTIEELQAALRDSVQEMELDESELDKVAGGAVLVQLGVV